MVSNASRYITLPKDFKAGFSLRLDLVLAEELQSVPVLPALIIRDSL